MKLFEDQEDFLTRVRKCLARNKRIVAQLPTGGGKTVVQSEIVKRANAKGKSVCILVHRREIMLQFYNTLRKFGFNAELIMPGKRPYPNMPVYVGMVETFNRRIDKEIIDHINVDFFMLDEIHWGSYSKVVDQLDSKIIGFTATPKSTGKPELNAQFDDIVCGPTVQQLIDLGRLCPGVTYSVKHDFSHVKKKGGDYEDKALLAEFKRAKLYDGGVKKYYELCPDRKVICYNVNIQHSLDVANQFIDAGMKKVYHVDGKDCYEMVNGRLIQEDRDVVFNKFYNDEHAALCNVGVATTGYDCPDVGCIIENFSTLSLTKHHQTLGRGARVCEGKKNFIIIDMGRNYVRHKYYGEDVNWAEIFNNPGSVDPKKAESRRKDVRECEECGGVIKMKCKACPYCGSLYSDAEIEQFLLAGATMEEIREYRHSTLPVSLRKPVHKMDLRELREYGHHMNFSPRWANIVYSKRKR
jgi:superfamily II DNA or RNA helicase